jgi:hypothetical protein
MTTLFIKLHFFFLFYIVIVFIYHFIVLCILSDKQHDYDSSNKLGKTNIPFFFLLKYLETDF